MEIKVLASGSKGNCYYISDGVSPVLIECGLPWKQIQQTLEFRTSDIGAVLVSHEHKDHCKAFKDVMKAGIDLYASPGTIKALSMTGHRVKPVNALEKFMVGNWAILPFRAEHDAAGSLGFLLSSKSGEKLLYATDTFYLRYRFNGLTHIMVECNYSMDILRENVRSKTVDAEMKNRIVRSHFSLGNVKDFLRANDLSKVREIHLLHLSDNNSDEVVFKREIQALTGKPVYIAGEQG